MSSDLAIDAAGLSKAYRLSHQRGRATTLAEAFLDRLRRRRGDDAETFWALRDVDLRVKRGEVVGVIGRNGAGKSTLLKILSRITEPTSGKARVWGRVGSLLEVGTGFHPELTGRENIYLNGAVLGMRRAEIAREFEAIVDFAEIDRFLDTPVKRYSSGMYVRLAFAVAAHLRASILAVDEVLAVGDEAFQRKCLARMGEVAHGGRTVIFVSHNMAAVARLCQRAVLIDRGTVVLDADAGKVVAGYLGIAGPASGERSWDHPAGAPGDSTARLKAVRILQEGTVTSIVDIRLPVSVEIEYWNLRRNSRLMVAANFFNNDNIHLFLTADFQEDEWRQPRSEGTYRSRCVVPGNFFTEGVVRVLAEVCTREPIWESHVREEDAVSFNVVDHGLPGSVRSGWGRPMGGVVRPMLPWTTTQLSSDPDSELPRDAR